MSDERRTRFHLIGAIVRISDLVASAPAIVRRPPIFVEVVILDTVR